MLCPVSTGKSGSNWLDRLRSNKGFPAADNLDLDNFLNNANTDNSASDSLLLPNPEPTQCRVTQIPSDQDGEREWFGVVTNALCDLFNMGNSNDNSLLFSGKKGSRKQSNPKFFDINSNNNSDSIKQQSTAATASFHSDNNSNNVKDINDNNDDVDVDGDDDGGKEKCSSDKELKGYSKSEVTVIDTSFDDVWKFDKLVFRKKNVWKVKDKKGKSSWNFSSKKKKRKVPTPDISTGSTVYFDDSSNCNKKPKLSISSPDLLIASSSDHDQKLQDDKREEICIDTLDDHFQILRKRSPRKSKKNVSSVVLVKAIPTGNKCGKNLSKNRLKDTQKQ